jgi:GntR family transcriptional regulator, rspAB operon transcriptional repressor
MQEGSQTSEHPMAFTRRQPREPIAGRAYSSIKRRILDLTLAPGEAISETKLAGEFGLSRTPVREALKRLENDGLVEVIPQQGTFVTPIRREFLLDAQFARSALECALVREAAKKRTDRDMRVLDLNFIDQRAAVDAEDFNLLYRLDEEMHQHIASAAGRPNLWDLISEIKIHMDRARKLTLRPNHGSRLLRQHEKIIEAVREQNAGAAVEAMRVHLNFVVQHFDELIRVDLTVSPVDLPLA